MSFSLADRRGFYDELGKLLSAGIPYTQSLETMLQAHPGADVRKVLEELLDLASRENNLSDSFSSKKLPFDAMEIALISACEKSGQLQRGCEFLARYFGRLDAMRRQVLRRALYPVFILHLGILLLAIPRFFQGDKPEAVLWDVCFQFLGFYLLIFTLYFLVEITKTLAITSVHLDRLLNLLPLIGGIRKSLAISRFCITYQMQLDAGVNIIDSLLSAGHASASANFIANIRSIIPAVREGNPPGPALAATGIFPSALMRAIVIGEKTGKLDDELLRAASQYDEKALRGIETLGDWLTKIIYFIIVLFLAFNIVSTARESTRQINKLIEGE